MQRVRDLVDRFRPGRPGRPAHPPGGQPSHPQQQQAPAQQKPQPAAPAPAPAAAPPPTNTRITNTAGTLNIALVNHSTSSTVYAYITGQALDNNNALFLLQADGRTPYYPTSPSSVGSGLSQNCAIALGAPGNTVNVTIPHIAGGRIWFSIDAPLNFLLNPGPALVEPSVSNPSDPNININWGFCEFTFNQDQLYANISYVDFVSIPIALNLTTVNSGTQSVTGMTAGGLDQVCNGLVAQHQADGKGWDQLVVKHNGKNLRALSPNQGMVGNPNLFGGYYDDYVNRVYTRFTSQNISVDTQAGFGVVTAHVANGAMNFGGTQFSRPTTHDVFTCSTGPFQTGSNAETNAIIPRLAAAYNRSTLLTNNAFPAPANQYYKDPITNHYSRIVHQANADGRGYAFPYDDVQPSGGADQSGEVHAGDPKLFTITVGGGSAQHGRKDEL